MNDSDQQLDQFLDKALANYGNAGPRAGLEQRILATLRDRKRVAGRRIWWWVPAAMVSAAALIAAVAWIGYTRAKGNSPEVRVMSAREKPALESKTETSATGAMNRSAGVPPAIRRPVSKTSRIREMKREPKLDQFPSPAPLSEQEQLLTRYVSEYREKAVLVARAQTELTNRERQEESAIQARESPFPATDFQEK